MDKRFVKRVHPFGVVGGWDGFGQPGSQILLTFAARRAQLVEAQAGDDCREILFGFFDLKSAQDPLVLLRGIVE